MAEELKENEGEEGRSMEKPDKKDDETVRKCKTMRPERLKPLHNFTLSNLKWGSQRLLRCMKVDSPHSSDHHLRREVSPPRFGESSSRLTLFRHEEFEQPRQQPPLMNQRQRRWNQAATSGLDGGDECDNRVEERKKSRLREKAFEDEDERIERARKREKLKEKKEEEEDQSTPEMPWNLRTRKGEAGSSSRGANRILPKRNEHRKLSDTTRDVKEKERPKFSLSLTKKEIEEDFLAMTGNLPPRRPKKRTRTIQRRMDSLFPGLRLTNVTPDSYKVPKPSERRTW